MSEVYTYSIENDFTGDTVDLNNLKYEIAASSIAVDLSYINTDGDICSIVFDSAISGGEQETLDTVVVNHDNVPSNVIVSPISTGSNPVPSDLFWLNPANKVIYSFDSVRNIWVSAHRSLFSFARKGNSDGMYLPLLGDLDSVDDVYMPGSEATIISAFCRSVSGNVNKEFEIRVGGTSVYSFSYPGSLTYNNNTLNIPIGIQDKVQVYVVKEGDNIKNTMCRLEVAWRYDA